MGHSLWIPLSILGWERHSDVKSRLVNIAIFVTNRVVNRLISRVMPTQCISFRAELFTHLSTATAPGDIIMGNGTSSE